MTRVRRWTIVLYAAAAALFGYVAVASGNPLMWVPAIMAAVAAATFTVLSL